MAAKRVLGNDPFKRGAAPRVPVATKPVLTAVERPQTPELQTPSSTKPKPVMKPHAEAPSLGADPVPHFSTPVAFGLSSAPAAHPASPSSGADPIRHDAAPMGVTIGNANPVPHAASPSLVADPVSHDEAPTAVPLDGTQAHAHSPSIDDEPLPATPPPAITPFTPAAPLLSREGLVSSAKGLALVARTLLGRASGSTTVDAWGRDEALVEALRPIADALYEKYWRVTVEGADLVPPGPSVLVANHAGAIPIDGPVLHHALRRERPDLQPTRWLLEDQVFHAPGLGVLWNRLGAVRASPENALQLLAQHTPVAVFPEGFHGLSKPFAERYRLQRFGRGGYVKLAARAGVPIVPVAIVGAEETTPLFGKLPGGALGLPFIPVTLPPLPTRWVIKFGAPITISEGPSFANDLSGVQRVNEDVRLVIDALLKELLTKRGGVF